MSTDAVAIEADASEKVIEVYGAPGCSSCLRLKEYVEKTGLPFVYINVDDDMAARDRLTALGIHAPALCIGEEGIPGHNLKDVAEFIGAPYEDRPMLPPAELKRRYDIIANALARYLRQMSPENCAYTLPNRRRPMLDCAAHGASVVRAFLSAYYKNVYDMSLYAQPDEFTTAQEVVDLIEDNLIKINDWWEQDGIDDTFDRVVKTYAGHHTLHEVWEREVWHTAQHTRQIALALELQGIEPDGPLTEADLSGLPLPERIHE